MKKKTGRPTKEHGKKIIFQRIGIRYETYLRLKEFVEEVKKVNPEITMSMVIDEGVEKLKNKN